MKKSARTGPATTSSRTSGNPSFHECKTGRRKLAVKVVDIFGNDTMTIVDGNIEGETANERE